MSEAVSETCEVPVDYEARLSRLEQLRLERGRLDVEEQYLLAALAGDSPSWLSVEQEKEALDKHWVREEVACVMSLPAEVAGIRITTAVTLVTKLSDTLALVGTGQISLWHALAMVDATGPLSDDIAAAVQARVLAGAAGQSLGNFRRALRRAVHTLDPANAAQRRKRGMAERRVAVRHDEDGMCTFWAYLPSEGGITLLNRITTEATTADPEDERTSDQRRADALIALATGPDAGSAAPGSAAPGPTVYIAMSTLLGEDDQPGELLGAGPITATQARTLALAADASWWNLKLDEQGRMLDMSRTRYRPSAALRRFIETRDQYCRFPHCQRRAAACDIDHCQAWTAKRGETCPGNLQALCRRHHRLKHRAGWTAILQPDGTTQWTSPTSRRYTVPPAEIPPDQPSPESSKPRERSSADPPGSGHQAVSPAPKSAWVYATSSVARWRASRSK